MIEPLQTFALRQSHVNELGVHAFHIGEDEQLLDAGVIADVAFQLGVGITPLPRGLPKQRDVEQIRFGRLGDGRLRGRDLGRNQVRLHRVGVDAIIQLRQRAVEVPREREPAILVILEPLKFLDEVKLELRA